MPDDQRNLSALRLCWRCGGDAGDSWFDRSLCPCGNGLGAMHTRCKGCGAALDGCPFEDGQDD